MALRALLFSVTRIFAISATFGPFLGLLDTLAYVIGEKIPLEANLDKLKNSPNSYWDILGP